MIFTIVFIGLCIVLVYLLLSLYYVTYGKPKDVEHLGGMTFYPNNLGAELDDIVIPDDETYTDAMDPSMLTIQSNKKHEKSTDTCETAYDCPNNLFKINYKNIECPNGTCTNDLCCDQAAYDSSQSGDSSLKSDVKDLSSDAMSELMPIITMITPTLMDWAIKTKLERQLLEGKCSNQEDSDPATTIPTETLISDDSLVASSSGGSLNSNEEIDSNNTNASDGQDETSDPSGSAIPVDPVGDTDPSDPSNPAGAGAAGAPAAPAAPAGPAGAPVAPAGPALLDPDNTTTTTTTVEGVVGDSG